MQNLLKNLISYFFFFCISVYSAVATSVPVKIHKVELGPITLPSRIVSEGGHQTKIKPSIWNKNTLRFSEGMPQKIIVQKGDNLSTISERYAVPIRNIIVTNCLRAPYKITEGQRLTLLSPRMHIVQEDEDLYKIAEQHNVSLSSITRQNKIKAPYTLTPGQKLILPASPVAAHHAEKIDVAERAKFSSEKKVMSSQDLRLKLRNLPRRHAGAFKRPVRGKIISEFGPKGSGLYNDGINIRAAEDTKVGVADNGVVVYCGQDIKSYGNLILVKHDEGWITAYGHLKAITVRKGQSVKSGQKIGTVGQTGFVNVPQLHFEVRRRGKPLNPVSYM